MISVCGTGHSCHSTTLRLNASMPANSALAMPLTIALRSSMFSGLRAHHFAHGDEILVEAASPILASSSRFSSSEMYIAGR